MKRDMDIVRRIALATAELEHNQVLKDLPGVDRAVFAAHVTWMKEAGLLMALVTEFQSGEKPIAQVLRLTWDGCDFADAVRDDNLWNKAKDKVLKPSMSFTFGVLKDWLSSEIRDGLPTVRAAIQQSQ